MKSTTSWSHLVRPAELTWHEAHTWQSHAGPCGHTWTPMWRKGVGLAVDGPTGIVGPCKIGGPY